jgi:ketosteroid isomerase-like protein
MHRLAAFLVALSLPFAGLSQQPTPKPADPELLRALDREIWDPFVAAYAAGRADDYIALHSRSLVRVLGNAKRIDPYGEWAAATRAMFKSFADKGTKVGIRFRLTERIANGESASERGVFEFTMTPAGGEARRFYGRFHVLSRREEGRWKIIADYDSNEGGRVGVADFEAAHAPGDYARY